MAHPPYGRQLQELERDVDTHAHIGRHDDGNVFGRRRNVGFLCVCETCGADDQLGAQLAAHLEVMHRALWAREVDQHLAVA